MADSHPPFRLANDGLHPYLDAHGAFIGAAVPLLEKNARGQWQPRPRADLERLLSIGYGVLFDLGWRMSKLALVARALDASDRSMAALALVQAELPPLPDPDSARRMARANDLAKNFNPDPPRAPEGSEEESG